MNVIVEGPDGAGKSTLAAFVAQSLGWKIVASVGPTQNVHEFNERARSALCSRHIVFDRHPIVSERIYGNLRGKLMTDPDLERAFYTQDNVLIYYRGRSDDLSNHRAKEHDSLEHLAMIIGRHATICDEYDGWALERAHLIYRRGDNKQNVVKLIQARIS